MWIVEVMLQLHRECNHYNYQLRQFNNFCNYNYLLKGFLEIDTITQLLVQLHSIFETKLTLVQLAT